MTNNHWRKRTLLGSAALGLMASATHAVELGELKTGLAPLQNSAILTAPPSPVAAPDQGSTFTISPTTDMPAPTSEITVAGTLRGQILHRNHDTVSLTANEWRNTKGDLVGYRITGAQRVEGDSDTDVYSYNNRLSLSGKTDTALGQLRGSILFDMDNAFSSANLKKGWGEWDMAPGWVLAGGVNAGTSSLEYSPDWALSVIDVISATGGPTNATIEQVRMTYIAGPVSWALGLENASNGDFMATGEGAGGSNIPDLATRLAYAGTGVSFDVAAALADDNDNARDWTLGASAAFSLFDNATLLLAGNYARGYYRNAYKSANGVGVDEIYDAFGAASLHEFAPDGKVWSAGAGMSWALSDTTSLNTAVGYTEFKFDDAAFGTAAPFDSDVQFTHAMANIIYTPVTQFSIGFEVDYGRGNIDLTGSSITLDDSASAAGFGAGVGMWWRF